MVSPTLAMSEDLAAVIPNGTSITAGINLSGYVLCGIYISQSWTAASITLQASDDGVTFHDFHFGGSEVSLTVAAGLYVAIDPQMYLGIRHVRIRSGPSSLPVNQGAERTIKLMLARPVT